MSSDRDRTHRAIEAASDPSPTPAADSTQDVTESPLPRDERNRIEALLHGLAASSKAPIPDHIGPYQIRREIGVGGFGVVYEAWDPKAHRPVAIKVLRDDRAANPAARAWFLREIRATAPLDHPNLIRLLHTDEDQGRPYLVMPYIDGHNLDAWRRRLTAPLPLNHAAQIVHDLADALQHAHAQGILHRDIKPSNILLTIAPDGRPTPRLADFGLARIRAAAADHSDSSSGAVGTLQFMAPESFTARSRDVDPRADVYALGVVLYELLTGRNPFKCANDADTIRRVCQERPPPPRRCRPDLPLDLQNITLKCLHKQPNDRYPSAADLRDDLARFLRSAPVRARPLPWPIRAARQVAARPRQIALASSALLLLVAITAASFHSYSQKVQESRLNDRRARRFNLAAHLTDALAIDPTHPDLVLPALDQAKTALGPDESPGFPYLRARNALDRLVTIRADFPTGPSQFAPVADPDGRRRLVGFNPSTNTLWLLDIDRNKLLAFPQDRHYVVAASPSNPTFWMLPVVEPNTNSDTDPYTGYRFEIRGDEIQKVQELPNVAGAAGGPFVAQVLVGDDLLVPSAGNPVWSYILNPNLDVKLPWNVRERVSIARNVPRLAYIAPDSRKLHVVEIIGNRLEVVRFHQLGPPPPGPLCEYRTALSPDGRRVAFAADSNLSLLDNDTGTITPLGPAEFHPRLIAFSDDGRYLAAPHFNGDAVNLFDLTAETPIARQLNLPTQSNVLSIAFTHQGRDLAVSLANNPRLYLWHLDAPADNAPLLTLPTELNVVLPDSNTTAFVAAEDHVVRRVDLESGRVLATFSGFPSGINKLVINPIARTLIASHWDESGTISIRDLNSGRSFTTLTGHRGPVRALALAPDGQTLASGGSDGEIRLWNLPDQSLIRAFKGHTDRVRCLAFLSQQRLASGSDDRKVRLWDRSSPDPTTALEFDSEVNCLAISPDSSSLAIGLRSGSIRLLDPSESSTQDLGRIVDADGPFALAFSPDGLTLAVAGSAGSLTLWDPLIHLRVTSLESHTGEARSVAFTPDGSTLLSTGQDGRLHRWTSR